MAVTSSRVSFGSLARFSPATMPVRNPCSRATEVAVAFRVQCTRALGCSLLSGHGRVTVQQSLIRSGCRGCFCVSDTAHPFTFVQEHVELAALFRRRKINFRQWLAGA